MNKKILVLCFAVMFSLFLGVGLAFAIDWDGDGYDDGVDNCACMFNPDQIDSNGDGYGNICDSDIDNDGIVFWSDYEMLSYAYGAYCLEDTCEPGYSCWGDYSGCDYHWRWNPDCDVYGPYKPDAWVEMMDYYYVGKAYGRPPGPGVGQMCDGDSDGIADNVDNCLGVCNPGQEDADNDGIGDVCDTCTDADRDGYGNPGYPANTCSIDYCPDEDSTGFDADKNGCIDTIEGLPDVINTLPSEVLSDEIKNSLVSKVDNAFKSVDKANDDAAINQLQAFINQVNAQRGNKISEEAADMLIAYANNLITKIQAG